MLAGNILKREGNEQPAYRVVAGNFNKKILKNLRESQSLLSIKKKLAKLKYLPNNFKIVEDCDHVLCAISGIKISLENLTYWNVELQEAYYSFIEANSKRDKN